MKNKIILRANYSEDNVVPDFGVKYDVYKVQQVSRAVATLSTDSREKNS